MHVAVLLFDEFETLDVFGPVEVFGKCEDVRFHYCSIHGGAVKSSQDLTIQTQAASQISACDVLLIPGGRGTRGLVSDSAFIAGLKNLCPRSRYILTVCTGSALLGMTGLLDGKIATSNKRSFDWVVSTNDKVSWQKSARWTSEGYIYTSSGVSAGIDMTLGFVADLFGRSLAEEIADHIEYVWNSDKDEDPFAV